MARRITSDHLALGRPIVLERRVGRAQRKARSTIIGVKGPSYLIVDLPFVNGRPIPGPDDKQCIVRLVSEGSAIGFRAKVARTYLEPFPMAILLYPPEFQEVPVRQTERVSCSIVATLMPDVETPAGSEVQRAAAAQESPPAPEAKKADSSSRTKRKNAAAKAPPPRPQAPLQAMIVDLSRGGCQVAIPILEPDRPSQAPPELRERVAPAREGDYHPDGLRMLFIPERLVSADFDLPEPAPGRFREVQCETRWTRIHRDTLLAGLRFLKCPDPLARSIETIVQHQQAFFRQPIEPA